MRSAAGYLLGVAILITLYLVAINTMLPTIQLP